MGVGLAALVGIAVLMVRFRAFTLGVRRTVRPARLHVGESARVELAVANRGRLTTPVLTLRDPVAGTAGARVRLAPLRPGRERQAAYRLPTSRRGILSVGPLEALRTDPLGLARRKLTVSGTVEVVVYPRVDRINAAPGRSGAADRGPQPPDGPGLAPRQLPRAAGVRAGRRPAPRPLALLGPDRRARRAPGRAAPPPGRRRSCSTCGARAHAGLSLERAVSVAASVMLAARRAGQEMVLAATDGTAMLLRPGESAASVLEYLAIAKLSTAGSLRGTLSSAIGALGPGSVVLVTGRAVPSELASLAGSRHGFVIFAVATDGTVLPTGTTVPGVRLIDGGSEERFITSWEQAMATAVRAGAA